MFRTVGHGGDSGSIEDLEKAAMTVLIGTNTAEAHPVIASRMKRAQKLFGQKSHVCENMKWLNVLMNSTNLNQELT